MSLENNKLTQYIKDSWIELHKVIWPPRKLTTNHTVLVILVSVAVAAFLGFVDYLLNLGLEKYIAR